MVEKIFQAGVVGAGGAGFPTFKKFTTGTEWLIINAAECEPLLRSDIYALTNYSRETISALDALQKEFGFKNVVMGIKGKHHKTIQILRKTIEELGSEVELFEMDNCYPAGDEQIMVYEITGKTVPPGGIPLQVGCVVINNTTALHIYHAMEGQPVTRRIVTVAGEVNNPVLIDVPIGTSIADCVRMAGGSTLQEYVVIIGGPMMGAEIDHIEAETTYIKKVDGGIIVIPKDHPLRQFMSQSMDRIQNQGRSACIQCSYCTDMCPRYLIGHQIRPHLVMRSLGTDVPTEALRDVHLCCECGICELYACPMMLSPRQVNIYYKKKLREEGKILKGNPEVFPEYTEMYKYRKIPQPRIVARLNLQDYDIPITEKEVHNPDKVDISLQHGIGKPATPIVKVGDTVKMGDLIGEISFEDMGSMIHASIDGKITGISEYITIEKQ